MPVSNENAVGSQLDLAEPDAGDFTNIENVFQGYSVQSGGAVTAQGSPNGTVAVASGMAKVGHVSVTIVPGNVSVISGSANPDGTTATAADATMARFSLITINSSGQLGVVHGTPAPLGPNNDQTYTDVFPTFASKTILAAVRVLPAATTVTSTAISEKREINTDGDFIARRITPTALSAAANDYNPTGLSTANVVRQATNSTVQRNISGLWATGFTDGKLVYFHNLGPGDIGLLSESTSSSATNRFSLVGDIVVPVGRTIGLMYDSTASRWRALGAQTAAGANTLALGSAVVAGTSPYFLRADDTIAAFDATAPVTQAYSDAAATGSAAFAARRDHKHGMPAGSGGLLASLSAPTSSIVNAETVILSASIPANTLTAGATFVLKAAGVGTTSTAPGTTTFRARINPTTLNGSSVTNVAVSAQQSRTAKPWSVEFEINIYTIGASGTAQGEGRVFANDSGSTELYVTYLTLSTSTATLVVDSTVTNLIELTAVTGAATSSMVAYTAHIRKV